MVEMPAQNIKPALPFAPVLSQGSCGNLVKWLSVVVWETLGFMEQKLDNGRGYWPRRQLASNLSLQQADGESYWVVF